MQFPESLNKAVENLTDSPTKAAGTTLADIWFLVFGGLSQCAEKRRLRYAHDLEEYHKQLNAKIEQIPEEHRAEPSIQVTAQALETSKYCISELELREMFVNLISNSMDDRFSSDVHPSFPEIIKQMTPLDAKIIASFKTRRTQPVVNIQANHASGGFLPLMNYAFLCDHESDLKKCATSISSLERLGLLSVNFDTWFTKSTAYDAYEKHLFFTTLKSMYTQQMPGSSVELEKGLCRLTPLGDSFISVCLSQ